MLLINGATRQILVAKTAQLIEYLERQNPILAKLMVSMVSGVPQNFRDLY